MVKRPSTTSTRELKRKLSIQRYEDMSQFYRDRDRDLKTVDYHLTPPPAWTRRREDAPCPEGMVLLSGKQQILLPVSAVGAEL